MTAYWLEVAHLVLRYFHVITGIAWIGASFYFVWLDNSLREPPQWKKDKGIKGDLWAIHGGGFYEVAKYQNAPEQMPETLHWFKWEAYTTWITGTLLLILLYYISADAYLMDPAKTDLGSSAVIAISIASIAVMTGIYYLLCKTPLVDNGKAFAVVMVLLVLASSWFLNQYVSDRAAYIHVGAIIGTIMAANVFFVIIPGQRYMVNQLSAGQTPDPEPGLRGKRHSVHNNYATLPIIFIMLSNHFPFTFGHDFGWLILPALFVIGMWIRHFFNLKHVGIHKPWVLVSGLIAFLILMVAIGPKPSSQANATIISDTEAMSLVQAHCIECHSQTPSSQMFTAPPLGFVMDNIDQVRVGAVKAHTRLLVSKDMPLGNMTQMTDKERQDLGNWMSAQ